MHAASAIAAITIARYAFSAAVPLFTKQMFGALGVGGGGSLIAGVATLLAGVPFVFWRYAKGIRSRSRFAGEVILRERVGWREMKDPTEYRFED
ncbi:hypothetical protein IMZ48_38935 [Candidatus Bathyarchaeota archaeon]|nr:hypothetical protein [Candidatus Bathyarchaeota archaeon]